MDTITHAWMHDRILKARTRREWSSLPAEFELRAVRQVFDAIRPHFARTDILKRIHASRATTFEDLANAVTL